MSINSQHNHHSVSRLLVHLVFVVKYRRDVISEPVWKCLEASFQATAQRLGLRMVELNHDLDHVHLVMSYPPKISVSAMVTALKGASAHLVRGKLWGGAFWSSSFFAASCGGAQLPFSGNTSRTRESLQRRAKARGFNPRRIR